MVVLEAASQNDIFTVALAFLNVLQTVALAYLAADRHAVRQARQKPPVRPPDVP